jgi:3-carboxy-cis,cis-muconate cycloisomerase
METNNQYSSQHFGQFYREAVYGDTLVFTKVSALFSDQNTLRYYLDVESALAEAEGELGVIPKDAAKAIKHIADTDFLDLDSYTQRTKVVGFPIVAVVEQLTKQAGEHGKYVHWGATTQDIMDTALTLQLKETLTLFEGELENISAALLKLIGEHRTTVMAGRSQMQHALPITFAFKVAMWLEPISTHLTEIRRLQKDGLYLQFGGAVGTLASLKDEGVTVRKVLADKLELKEPRISWHSSREKFVEVAHRITIISGTLGKIGKDISLMSQSEVGEAHEKKVPGRGTSSTMPQKSNPISAQALVVAAKRTASQMNVLYEALLNDHERGTGTWQSEWFAIPDICVHAAGALGVASDLLAGLEVSSESTKLNLGKTNGLILAENVMMQLAEELGRQEAHDLVITYIAKANENSMTLKEVLIKELDSKRFSHAEIESWFDPEQYLGTTNMMIDSILKECGGT